MKITVGFILFALSLLAGCTTESKSNISNYEGATTSRISLDKDEAASKRVAAAQAYIQRNNLERAKFHLDKAHEHNSNYPDLHYTLGFYYQIARDYSLADSSFRRAISLDGSNAEYKNGYGQFLCTQKKYQDAHKYFDQAIANRTYSNVAQAYVNAGLCKLQEGKPEEAIEFYSKALNINSKSPAALLELAQYEFDKERFARTRNYIQRFREVSRHTPRSLWLGLRAEHALGNKDAVSSYALQLEQMYPDAKETLEYLDSRESWK